MPVVLFLDECVMFRFVDDFHYVCSDEEQKRSKSQNKEQPGLNSHLLILRLLEFRTELALSHNVEGTREDKRKTTHGNSRNKLKDEADVLDEDRSCHLAEV